MEEKETYIYFASVGGTNVDFKNIDLSPWRIQGGLVESEKIEKLIKSNSIAKQADRNWEMIKKYTQESEFGGGKHEDWEYINLLFPIYFDNPPNEDDYFEAIEAIRIAHPSEIYIRNIIGAQYFKSKGIFIGSGVTFRSNMYLKFDDPKKYYFYYTEDKFEYINKFLAYYKKCNIRNYIKTAIKYYSSSYQVNSPEMSFICLCICLETIVPGKEQLSFRFRRNLAVLCSDSLESGKDIFENAKKLYDFRSKLIHSGIKTKDLKKFNKFFEYAQIIASRMIIEMLKHNIPEIQELDKKINEIGFGNRNKISKDYKEF